MQFALDAHDSYQCVLEALLRAGWRLEKLFLSQVDWLHDNRQLIARALELGAEVQQSPARARDLVDLGQRGCAALVVAGYNWKIPAWQADLRYAVNFHPSPLPEGRGPYPLVRAILEQRTSWAVCCHRINERFDQGEILDTEHFPLDPDECHESLQLKSQMAAARLAERLAGGFEPAYQAAVPQGIGSYWARWSEQDRVIDFTQPVEAIMRRIRAFGDLECMATINQVKIFIHRAKAWPASHQARPGAVVHASNMALVVAAADGLLAITEWSLNPPGAILANPGRQVERF
jgi:methionyl-tRNA formyltransferase